jgi:hypothetical protein
MSEFPTLFSLAEMFLKSRYLLGQVDVHMSTHGRFRLACAVMRRSGVWARFASQSAISPDWRRQAVCPDTVCR